MPIGDTHVPGRLNRFPSRQERGHCRDKPIGDNAIMTNRERIFACFHGEDTDRFPVWLKMAISTWQTPQPEPWRSMSALELLDAAGCDAMIGCSVGASRKNPHVTQSIADSNGVRTTTVRTPDGVLTSEVSFEDYTRTWHPTGYMIKSVQDLRRARWLFRDTDYTVDALKAAEALRKQKTLAQRDVVTFDAIGPTPLMDMVEHLCGLENAVYLLRDEPDLFREVLSLAQEDKIRRLCARIPCMAADMVWMIENTSTTLISPRMFEEFSVPHLAEYGAIILEHGRIPVHHMCGTLNALLEMVDSLPAQANEAFTTRPLGDVSLAEGRRRMPSKALIGGTNATLWLEPVETIVETVAQDLAGCPDRRKIFLTSAGVLPPPVSFEKAKRVVQEFKRL